MWGRAQWRTQNFHLSDVENGQIKKLNNKIINSKVSFNKFLEAHWCGRTRMVTCRSTTVRTKKWLGLANNPTQNHFLLYFYGKLGLSIKERATTQQPMTIVDYFENEQLVCLVN